MATTDFIFAMWVMCLLDDVGREAAAWWYLIFKSSFASCTLPLSGVITPFARGILASLTDGCPRFAFVGEHDEGDPEDHQCRARVCR
jgi:hypothetical protein